MAYLLPQEAQLEAEHPLHDDEEEEAGAETSPPPPARVTKPHLDMSLERSLPLQAGHRGTSRPMTSSSKVLRQVLQVYSKMGMIFSS
jgi:hypothetical protein